MRLWTSLLDSTKHPAKELLALYARRWEQELFYKELKVDMRSTPCLQSHTPLTAMQEIAALILAYQPVEIVTFLGSGDGAGKMRRLYFLSILAIAPQIAPLGIPHFLTNVRLILGTPTTGP